MSINVLANVRRRAFAATSSVESGPAGVRGVAAVSGSDRSMGERSARESREQRSGESEPRDRRELEVQREALTQWVLGAFEVVSERDVPAAGPLPDSAAGERMAPPRDPRLEEVVLKFMYALFHALDDIDAAEPTLELINAVPGVRAGRHAFGERLDALARRIAAEPSASPGSAAQLVIRHAEVIQVIQANARRASAQANLGSALAALLHRLANALRAAPSLGYGAPATAGAMLRVRA
jgi:hypothetical protein